MQTDNKIYSKVNTSSLQVLKTLRILLEDNYSMQDIVKKLNENETDFVFNNSVVSKYINTCRQCGIVIPKICNKYFVVSLPFGMKLHNHETDLINSLQEVVSTEMSEKSNKIYNCFIEKLNRYASKKIAKTEKNSNVFLYEVFEKAVADKRKIKLLLKNNTEINVIPLSMVSANGKVFFSVYYQDKQKMIDINRIAGIQTLNEKFTRTLNDQVVVFVLKDNLAKRYELRENEMLLSISANGDKVISNRGENWEILLSRLLRYDACCEVKTPKPYREDMKKMIEDTLKNYGE